jgi:hypothetical protein
LFLDLTPNEWKILDWFESKEYKRINVIMETSSESSSSRGENNDLDTAFLESSNTAGASSSPRTSSSMTNVVPAQAYLWINPHSELDFEHGDWDYQHFYKEKLEWYLEYTCSTLSKRSGTTGVVYFLSANCFGILVYIVHLW